MSELLPHLVYLVFFFALGAVVGSFLNVVAWRLPRGESVVSPPSHCPKCNTKLAWRDNIPIFGWLLLRGRCRYCRVPISPRYPIVEAITAILFTTVYWALFIAHTGPSTTERGMTIDQDWPLFALYLLFTAVLLVSSLIDFDHYSIPVEACWLATAVAIGVHAFIAMPGTPGTLLVSPLVGSAALGGGIGVLISILLLRKKWLTQSFAEGGPLLEFEKKQIADHQAAAKAKGEQVEEHPIVEFSPKQIRAEMRLEMLFLMPPLLLAFLCVVLYSRFPAIQHAMTYLINAQWPAGLLGSIWGALIGAAIIWIFRILGSYAFGREAMGLGDVHLMLAIGATLGAAGSVYTFFIAPFFGLLFGVYKLFRRQGREVPYGPFLSLAAFVVMLCYARLDAAFGQPLVELVGVLQHQLFGP